MLQLNNVTKRFGGLTAVKGLSFDVHEGEIVGLIGPNGAGKTTAFNVITGFLRADEGEVVFRGQPITHLRPDQICHLGMCRTFQVVKPFGNATVLDNVVVGALAKEKRIPQARQRALEIVRLVGLEDLQDAIARELTIGNRKRLEVARALATGPRLLLLDEPMGGLNPTESKDLVRLLRTIVNKEVTILMIEHDMQTIMQVSDRIVVIHHGEKIAEGTPREVATDPRVVQAYLGEEFYIAQDQ